MLSDASFTGDRRLIRRGLALLHGLDRFAGTVPRGAQTWEVPLHTPDILASANLVHAYVLGYELSGDPVLLRNACYWAWTSVPFVYLASEVTGAVSLYATVPVYGASNWVAPDWMGTPVQWCGLELADALYRLAHYDMSGPWQHLADGITASGIQQSYPLKPKSDRVGLLPDSFNLQTQNRNDPAINPGTVELEAMQLFRKSPVYDFRSLRNAGYLVNAPGAITVTRDRSGDAEFRVEGWPSEPYRVLITGVSGRPQVFINGRKAAADNSRFLPNGRLILTISHSVTIRVVSLKPR